jgi:hypothetical protein
MERKLQYCISFLLTYYLKRHITLKNHEKSSTYRFITVEASKMYDVCYVDENMLNNFMNIGNDEEFRKM